MNKQKNIEIAKLRPFEGHPYKVIDNEEMESLTESIAEQGVLSPLIVRPIENTDQYEIISGHRRFHAAQKAGLKAVPAFVFEIDRDAAAVMLVDSNLHREHILPSEKAFAYKLKLDALKHQGTSGQLVQKWSRDSITDTESGRQVQRYIRLTYLIPEILQKVDDGTVAMSPAMEISYLTENEQCLLLDAMELNDCTPSHAQAIRLKKMSQERTLTAKIIGEIMAEEKPNQQEQIKLKRDEISKYFPQNCTVEKIRQDILKGLELLQRQRKRDRDAR